MLNIFSQITTDLGDILVLYVSAIHLNFKFGYIWAIYLHYLLLLLLLIVYSFLEPLLTHLLFGSLLGLQRSRSPRRGRYEERDERYESDRNGRDRRDRYHERDRRGDGRDDRGRDQYYSSGYNANGGNYSYSSRERGRGRYDDHYERRGCVIFECFIGHCAPSVQLIVSRYSYIL